MIRAVTGKTPGTLPGLVSGMLLFLLSSFSAPEPVHAQERNRGACADAVQGEVAWDYEGNTRWSPRNVERLCEGAEDSNEPARCFERVMHGGVNWGGGTRWSWRNAIALCSGSRDAGATVACFEDRVGEAGWKAAIQACRGAARAGGGMGQAGAGAGNVTPRAEMAPVGRRPAGGVGDAVPLARLEVTPGAIAGATTPSDLRELPGLAGAVSPSDLGTVEPADMDFHTSTTAPPRLSWDAKKSLMERAGIPFQPRAEPPSEFTLSPREHYRRGIGHLRLRNPADVDPEADRVLMPSRARGAIEVFVRAPDEGRYLLEFRVSARQEATYAMWVGEGDNPSYTRDAGPRNVTFFMEATEPGLVSGLFYAEDAAFTFHDVTVTRVE
jgi:hypothetical protein